MEILLKRGHYCSDCGEGMTPKHGRSYCASCESQRTIAIRRGITVKQLREMWAEQKGLCFLCPSPAEHLDHHHATNRVRRFLCVSCNSHVKHHENGTTRVPQKKYHNYLLME